MCQFSFFHVRPSFGCCVASMDVVPLLGCLYNGRPTSPIHPWYIIGVLCGQYGCYPISWFIVQWYINPTHAHINELRGVSTIVWMVGAHDTSHTIQCEWAKISQDL